MSDFRVFMIAVDQRFLNDCFTITDEFELGTSFDYKYGESLETLGLTNLKANGMILGRNRSDFAFGSNFWVIKQRAFDLLKDFMHGVESYPIELLSQGSEAIDSYRIIQIRNNISCLDTERSVFVKQPGKKGPGYPLHPVFHLNKIPVNCHLFREVSQGTFLFCTSWFRDAVIQHGIKGLIFEDIYTGEEIKA